MEEPTNLENKGFTPARSGIGNFLKGIQNVPDKNVRPEIVTYDTDYLKAPTDYLAKMSPNVGLSRRLLGEATMATADFLNIRKITGFEVISRTEGARGPFGDTWREQGLFNLNLMNDLEINGNYARQPEIFQGIRIIGTDLNQGGGYKVEKKNSQYIKEAIRAAVDVAGTNFLNNKYISSDWTLKDRKADRDNTVVRLISRQGFFMDVPFSVVDDMLKDKLIDGGRERISDIELFLNRTISAKFYEDDEPNNRFYKIHAMNKWNKVNEELTEPVFLVLSLSEENEKPRLVHDPGIFAHVNVVVTKGDTHLLRGLNVEFSHATNGVPGTNDFYVPVVREIFKGDSERVNLRSQIMDVNWSDPLQTWRTMDVSVQPFGTGKNIEVEEGFFEDDKLMGDFASLTGIKQIDVRTNISSAMGRWIRAHSEKYGGSAVCLSLLSILDVSGQAPMFVIDNPQNGLQIGLGLGGTDLMLNLRGILKKLTGKQSHLQFSEHDIKDISDFWKYWNDKNWKFEISQELDRGRRGHASITTFSHIVGQKGRGIVQDVLTPSVVPEWANYSIGRSMLSSLGGIPKDIAPFMEKITFYTARAKDYASVIGEMGDEITVQFLGRDPVIFAESIGELIKRDKSSMGISNTLTFLGEAMQESLRTGSYSKYGISREAMMRCEEWLVRLMSGEKVENATFGSVYMLGNKQLIDADLATYLGSMGENAKLRKKVMDASRALVFLFMAAQKMDKGRVGSWGTESVRSLRNEVEKLAKAKTAEYVSGKIKLGVLHEYASKNIDYDAIDRALQWCTAFDSLKN